MPFAMRGAKFTVLDRDMQTAAHRWTGVTLNPNEREAARDKAFYDYFSTLPHYVDAGILGVFARPNRDKDDAEIGGYDCQMDMQGGVAHCASQLGHFFRDYVAPAVEAFEASPDAYYVHTLIADLAAIRGFPQPGRDPQPLGLSAATKILYFACPRMPVFMYDSVVGDTLGMRILKAEEYPVWDILCSDLLYRRLSFNLKPPVGVEPDWFRRRCFDLMLRRLSPRTARKKSKAA